MSAPVPVVSLPLRWLYVSLGSVALVLGVLGIFVPVVLPTTPFLLLAAWCYAKGSTRLHHWLVSHRHLGPILDRWWSERAVPRRAKVYGILLVWLGIGSSVVWAVDSTWLRVVLVLIGLTISGFLLSLRTWSPSAPMAEEPVSPGV